VQSNKHGILVATTEDHWHACNSGIMLNLAEVAYGGLMAAETKVLGMDHNDKVPFDCTDHSIEFICDNLKHHGLGFFCTRTLMRFSSTYS
jgi:hypothetical protein